MSRMIQALENRMLMSATLTTLAADEAALAADAASTKAALLEFRASEVTLYSAVVDTVKSTETKAQAKGNLRLAGALIRADAAASVAITRSESSLLLTAKAKAAGGYAAGKALLAHPTKPSTQKAVTKAIAVLEASITPRLAALESAVSVRLAAIDAVYSNIAIADPYVASTINSDEVLTGTASTAFTTAAAKIEADVTQLATDLGTV